MDLKTNYSRPSCVTTTKRGGVFSPRSVSSWGLAYCRCHPRASLTSSSTPGKKRLQLPCHIAQIFLWRRRACGERRVFDRVERVSIGVAQRRRTRHNGIPSAALGCARSRAEGSCVVQAWSAWCSSVLCAERSHPPIVHGPGTRVGPGSLALDLVSGDGLPRKPRMWNHLLCAVM